MAGEDCNLRSYVACLTFTFTFSQLTAHVLTPPFPRLTNDYSLLETVYKQKLGWARQPVSPERGANVVEGHAANDGVQKSEAVIGAASICVMRSNQFIPLGPIRIEGWLPASANSR